MRKNKYNAKKTNVDGIRFDSKKEAGRYIELKQLERAGKIRDLKLQVPFKCVVEGHPITTYKADFQYFDIDGERHVVEDVKGMKRGPAYSMFRLKKKLVKALHKVEVQEI